MLTQPQAVAHLLRRELIGAASIVEGHLAVADASRRNRNFTVTSERGPSYLLKQRVGPSGTATGAHEALVYEFLRSLAAEDGLDDYLPRYYGYDPEEKVLVLELLPNAQDFREFVLAELPRTP